MASVKFTSDFVGTVGKQGVTFNGTTSKIPIPRRFKHKRHNPFLWQVLPLVNAWQDIKRRWRNLFIKTYAGTITKKWLKEYRRSEYINTLKQL